MWSQCEKKKYRDPVSNWTQHLRDKMKSQKLNKEFFGVIP